MIKLKKVFCGFLTFLLVTLIMLPTLTFNSSAASTTKNFPSFNPQTDIPWDTFPSYITSIFSSVNNYDAYSLINPNVPLVSAWVLSNSSVRLYAGVNIALCNYFRSTGDNSSLGTRFCYFKTAKVQHFLYCATYNYKTKTYTTDWYQMNFSNYDGSGSVDHIYVTDYVAWKYDDDANHHYDVYLAGSNFWRAEEFNTVTVSASGTVSFIFKNFGYINGLGTRTGAITQFYGPSSWYGSLDVPIYASTSVDISSGISSVNSTLNALKTAIVNKLDDVKTSINSTLTTVKTAITDKLESVKTSINSTLTTVKTAITDSLSSFKNSVDTALTSVNSSLTTIKNNFNLKLTALRDAINNKLQEIKDAIIGDGSEPPDTTSNSNVDDFVNAEDNLMNGQWGSVNDFDWDSVDIGSFNPGNNSSFGAPMAFIKGAIEFISGFGNQSEYGSSSPSFAKIALFVTVLLTLGLVALIFNLK